MGEQDGQTVNSGASTGAALPAVDNATAAPAPQADPIEAKIQAAVAEALKKQEPEIARRIQSEADKRVAPIQRRLTEAESRARMLEGTLQTLPGRLGDLDPDVQQRVRLAQAEARLNLYDQANQATARQQQEDQYKQQALEDMRQEVAKLGVNPDDPRIKYDLNAPSIHAFTGGVMASVAKIKEDDAQKSLDARIAQAIADRDAKARRESGVDSHDNAGAAGADSEKAFKEAQAAFINDPNPKTQKALEEARAKRKK